MKQLDKRNCIKEIKRAMTKHECRKLLKNYKTHMNVNFGTKQRYKTSAHRKDYNRGVQYITDQKILKKLAALADRPVENIFVTVVAVGSPPTGNVGWHYDSFLPRYPHFQVCSTVLVGLNSGHGGDLMFKNGYRYRYVAGDAIVFHYSHASAGRMVRYGRAQHRSHRMYKKKALLTVLICKKEYVNNAWLSPQLTAKADAILERHKGRKRHI